MLSSVVELTNLHIFKKPSGSGLERRTSSEVNIESKFIDLKYKSIIFLTLSFVFEVYIESL